MATLYKTTAGHDWKGRPDHKLEILGTGTQEELLALQAADIERWQANDIAAENEQIAIENEGEDSIKVPPITEWDETGAVAMDEPREDGGREFFHLSGDGDYWSIVYHIV